MAQVGLPAIKFEFVPISKIPPTQIGEPELTGPRFISSVLMGQDFPPKAMVILTVALQAKKQTERQIDSSSRNRTYGNRKSR